MANTRYGLKEVANVIFFDLSTKKPVLFFDTLKVSTIENESESAEARGGQGNNKLISWDFGRTVTLTMQDALLSDVSLAMLAGTQVQNNAGDITAVGREQLTLTADGTVTLAQAPVATSVTAFKVENKVMTDEVTLDAADVTDKAVALEGLVAGDTVVVFYEYIVQGDASKVVFRGDAFPSTYKVVGDTYVRDENGVDHKMQFIIGKAKLQTNFSLTMDVENVSTFDFNLEVLADATTKELYQIVRISPEV